MNRKDYKSLIDRIGPDKGLEERIMKGMKQNQRQTTRMSRMGVAGVTAAVMLGLVVVASLVLNLENEPANSDIPVVQQGTGENTPPTAKVGHDPVTIPKIELPDESNVKADMIGLVVYQGNIYTQTGTQITPDIAKQLRGDKLGRSKSGITEWSSSDDYTEFASTIGEMDIFTVKGYDADFRIMSYMEHDGEVYAELYEHLNGITVAKGEDIIGKLNLMGNMTSVKWQDFDSWNMGESKLRELADDTAVQAFVEALNEAKPVAADALFEQGIYETGPSQQKFLYIQLQDGTEVQLRLFKGGQYVRYANTPVFFQLEGEAFTTLWGLMEE
ncbi:hypothetical protein AK95_08875 [Paenibacillus sp. LC231]|uniref:hypothetical protein n=1 Tax=Paenibacillus sp. LC231 TaxID=1120679 RepID=UPI0008DE5B7A|nr:hypothetical protein [Paenibacillus sp. LC231]OIB03716.1 hypothetical protein AK95_08875 [Paenibacillus sp. LC231]